MQPPDDIAVHVQHRRQHRVFRAVGERAFDYPLIQHQLHLVKHMLLQFFAQQSERILAVCLDFLALQPAVSQRFHRQRLKLVGCAGYNIGQRGNQHRVISQQKFDFLPVCLHLAVLHAGNLCIHHGHVDHLIHRAEIHAVFEFLTPEDEHLVVGGLQRNRVRPRELTIAVNARIGVENRR